MIRAVVKGGMFQPLEPLPTEWSEGHQVVVQDMDGDGSFSPDQLDAWLRRGNELAAELSPQEGTDLMAELDRLRAEQKELMRRRRQS